MLRCSAFAFLDSRICRQGRCAGPYAPGSHESRAPTCRRPSIANDNRVKSFRALRGSDPTFPCLPKGSAPPFVGWARGRRPCPTSGSCWARGVLPNLQGCCCCCCRSLCKFPLPCAEQHSQTREPLFVGWAKGRRPCPTALVDVGHAALCPTYKAACSISEAILVTKAIAHACAGGAPSPRSASARAARPRSRG